MYDVVAIPKRLFVVSGVAARGQCRRRGAGSGAGLTEDRVEPLEEGLAVDEVEALARVAAEVADDEVHVARAAADVRVEGALSGAASAVMED